MNENVEDLMLDLLSKKAIYGLDASEEKQLADLQRQTGGGDESLSFELTAAAIGSTGIDTREEMPAALRERILADAAEHFGSAQATTEPASRRGSREPAQGSMFGWLGWAFAAVACAALGLNLYYTWPDSEIAIESLTPAQMRQRLIDSAPDLVRGSWSEGKMAEMKPAGDVVWSDSMQTGYMRVSGLPKNDPSRETYQLWIVAENQDPKTPVDGGTFDINSDGEVIIPIDAKVKALNPKAFAITIEKPGGVPVSTQGKLAAVAKSET
jgi:anti-sigma-K factor RskA